MSESLSGRHAGSVLVAGFGAALVAGRYRWIGSGRWGDPLAVAPLGLAVVLLVVAGWVARSDLDGRIPLWIPLLAATGAILGGALASVTGTPPPSPLALTLVGVGGALGAVAGVSVAARTATTRALRTREGDSCERRDESRAIFDAVGDGVLVHDARGRILAANDTARTRLGYDDATLVGLSIAEVEGDRPAGSTRRAAGDRVVYETVHVAADGTTVPVEVGVSRVRYHGAPAVVSVARDVDSRRASERELAHARDQLRALNRVFRHDIRNDMQIVIGLARLLEDDADDAARRHLRTIATTGEHVVELTRSARDLSRTLADGRDLPLEPVALADALTTELDRRREAYDFATVALDGDVPDVEVCANDLLSSVFRNLVNNAVQHSDRDHPTVTVAADFLRGDHRVRISVADDGPGISDERKRAVFGEGEKALDSEGSGLGLHLVRSLVDQYGGTVRIEDNEPRGTVVVVDLPVADRDDGTENCGGIGH